MFAERLEQVTSRIDGWQALALVASDGIPVEYRSNDPSIDIELLAAELTAQVRAVASNHRELAAGHFKHYSVATDRVTLMVTAMTSDYYLLAVLGVDASAGRARFELQRARLAFEQDLL